MVFNISRHLLSFIIFSCVAVCIYKILRCLNMNTLWLGAPVILSIQDLAMALIFGKYSKRPATQNRNVDIIY